MSNESPTSLSHFSNALELGLFLDVPVNIALGLSTTQTLLRSTISVAAYAARKYCNDYVTEDFDKATTWGALGQSALCGGSVGALKYSLVKGFSPANMIMGGINNMLYEFSNHENKYNNIDGEPGFLHSAMAIEGFETFMQVALATLGVPGAQALSTNNFLSAFWENVKVGFLLEWNALTTLNSLDAPYKGIAYHAEEQANILYDVVHNNLSNYTSEEL